jgi:hypothetical protein
MSKIFIETLLLATHYNVCKEETDTVPAFKEQIFH